MWGMFWGKFEESLMRIWEKIGEMFSEECIKVIETVNEKWRKFESNLKEFYENLEWKWRKIWWASDLYSIHLQRN